MAIRMIRTLALVVAFAPAWAVDVQAQSSADRAVSLLVDELRAAGYTQISVTLRLVGGYVVEAQKDAVAVGIAIDGTDYSVTYKELLTEPTGGFFATHSRPPGGGVEGVLANYARRLGSDEGAAAPPPPGAFAGPDIPNPRTAAFSQSQTISASGETALIRRSETLGIQIPVVTDTDSLITAGDTTLHRVEHRTDYSVERASSITVMNGMSGFSQQIFTDPVGFRSSLSVDVTLGSMPQPPSAGVIVNQVVSSIEGNIGQMPETGRLVLPADLRGQITAKLTPLP